MSGVIAQVIDAPRSFLDRPTGEFIGLLFIAGVIAFLLICTVGYIWHQFRKTDIEASLKHDMIQRGMSADEIERVLAAGLSPGMAKNADSIKRTLPYAEPTAK